MGDDVKPVPDELLAHFEEMLKFDKPRSEAELRLLFDAVPALVAEVRQRRDADLGFFRTATEYVISARYKRDREKAKARAHAASMMLSALGRFLRCHDRCGTDCEHDKAQVAVTAALDAGIEPAK